MKLIIFDTEAPDMTPAQICQLSYLMADGRDVRGKTMFFTVDELMQGGLPVAPESIEAYNDAIFTLQQNKAPET